MRAASFCVTTEEGLFQMIRFRSGLAAASLLLVAGCATGREVPREAVVAEPAVCQTHRFDIYFADGQANLTPAARDAIGLTATRLQGCAIQNVQVIGLADARGAPLANQTLSQRRAAAVAEALMATGWPAPAFDVAAAGDQGAMVQPGVAEPLRRRTEVVVTASDR